MELHAFDNGYLTRLRASDTAVEQHFASYFRKLLLIKLRARRLAPSQIDDVCQETFVRVLAAIQCAGSDGEGLRTVECLGAFVNSVCNHILQEEYRQSSRSDYLDPADMQAIADKTVDLDGLLVTQEAGETVRRVLAQLPEKDRALLRAIFLEEKDKEDVCREFGVDRGYLRVLLHRAKARFRCRFRGYRAVARTNPSPAQRHRGAEKDSGVRRLRDEEIGKRGNLGTAIR